MSREQVISYLNSFSLLMDTEKVLGVILEILVAAPKVIMVQNILKVLYQVLGVIKYVLVISKEFL